MTGRRDRERAPREARADAERRRAVRKARANAERARRKLLAQRRKLAATYEENSRRNDDDATADGTRHSTIRSAKTTGDTTAGKHSSVPERARQSGSDSPERLYGHRLDERDRSHADDRSR